MIPRRSKTSSPTAMEPRKAEFRLPWAEAGAETAFAAARGAGPDDGPALALMQRIHGFKANPPAENWDGAWHLERK